MDFRRRKRSVPGLNTTSTADISFILLVFFLVISSMDSNKGVQKQLAPEDKAKTEDVTEIDRHNVLTISLLGKGDIRVDGKKTDAARLSAVVERFVARCPDRQRHVVSVEMLPTSCYDDYFHVQDAVNAAYSRLRAASARQLYRKPYTQLSEYQRKAVDKMVPQRVMEKVDTHPGPPEGRE